MARTEMTIRVSDLEEAGVPTDLANQVAPITLAHDDEDPGVLQDSVNEVMDLKNNGKPWWVLNSVVDPDYLEQNMSATICHILKKMWP